MFCKKGSDNNEIKEKVNGWKEEERRSKERGTNP
jgi:hypothetical protein